MSVLAPPLQAPTTTAAVYRGRFDPPGLHHVATIEALLRRFDRVVVMPWGPVGTRAIDENITPVFRARLIDLAFQRLATAGRVAIDLRDIEDATTSASLDVERTSPALHDCQVFHVVEAESLDEDLARLHEGANVVVVAADSAVVRDGFDVVRVSVDIKGAVMRQRLYESRSIDDLVPARVAVDIARHGLYRGIPRLMTRLSVPEPRLLLVADPRNTKAVAWSQRFKRWAVDDDPNLIVVFGGDGSMLHAIQQHWRRRVPFFGVNAGHLGFLLNDAQAFIDDDEAVAAIFTEKLGCYHLPMLHAELRTKDGAWKQGLTFNDAWLERSTGQSAWIEVKVDGRTRIEKLVCDGCLVSTAAGSTAYARSMGAHPLLADTPAWLIVGSNVVDPVFWKSALLSPSSVVEMRSLDDVKRPLNGFLHGVSLGEVTDLRARLSRASSVELAFLPDHDMAEKIARIQFPAPTTTMSTSTK